ncbi:MAG: hypothetical protein AAFR13_03165 [Pseudomonadota bacterium]
MHRATILLATALVAVSMGAAHAEPKCSCRYQGVDIPEGQTICIKLNGAEQLMQCDRVLNNTAWKQVQKGCEINGLSRAPDTAPFSHVQG